MKKNNKGYVHFVYLGIIACLLCYMSIFSQVYRAPAHSKLLIVSSVSSVGDEKETRVLEGVQDMFKQYEKDTTQSQLLKKGKTYQNETVVKEIDKNVFLIPKKHLFQEYHDKHMTGNRLNQVHSYHPNNTSKPPLQDDNDHRSPIKKSYIHPNIVLNNNLPHHYEETKFHVINQAITHSSDYIKFKKLLDPDNKIPDDTFIKMLRNFGKLSDLDFKMLSNRFNHPHFASFRKPQLPYQATGHIKSTFIDIVSLINAAQNESSNPYKNNSCDSCFHRDFNFMIENNHTCDNKADNKSATTIDLLIIVTTSYKHVNNRNILRTTWLTHARNNSVTSNVRYAFILGDTDDLNLKNAVMQENQEHRDIIMADFYDTYRNLTYKTITAMRWASTRCAHAQFVMKTDDDMWVNIPNLLRTISKNVEKLRTSVFGHCYKAKPIRELKSKWYASVKSYPHRRYPLMCSGTGYVLGASVARDIYDVSPYIPFFHLEDVYVSFCMKKLLYPRYNIAGFYYEGRSASHCFYKESKLPITVHSDFKTVMNIWNAKCIEDNKQRNLNSFTSHELAAMRAKIKAQSEKNAFLRMKDSQFHLHG